MEDLFILLLLLILSGFFSGAETALTTLSVARAEALAKEGRAGSSWLVQLKSNTTRMLVIILIGNNLVNIAASAMATVLATGWFGHLGPGIAVGVLTVVILIFGEVTPKSWAAKHAEKVSLVAAPVLFHFGRLVFPAVWALEHISEWLHARASVESEPLVTESEVISLVEHGAVEGTIEDDEREMIERVFAFNDLTVRDVMTPHSEVFSLDGALSIRDALPDILAQPWSRIPLYDKDPEDIIRVVYLRDVLEAVAVGKLDTPISGIAHEAVFVPETQPIDELFAALRRQSRHLAIVIDEHGMFQGVVTLEDLLEELVGEIYDETDQRKQLLKVLNGHTLLASGRVEMRVIAEHLRLQELPGKPTDTVSFWILENLARIPSVGEEFEINGLTIRVEDGTDRAIGTVRISRPA